MSMMGEPTYFLGLQIKQDDKGISICQKQYTRNLLKKYEISDSSLVKTPMVPPNNLGPDLAGKPVNETLYRGMIGSLMYLKGTPTIGLYYPKCPGFDLKGYLDSDYVGCNINKKTPQDPSKVAKIELMAHIIAVNNRRDSVSPPPLTTKPKKGKSQTENILGADDEMDDNPKSDETQHQSFPPQGDNPTSSTTPHPEAFDTDSLSDNILKNTTIIDLHKGLEVITQLLKDIKNSVRDDSAINKKIEEASETLAKISTQTTEILSLVRALISLLFCPLSRIFRIMPLSLERAQTYIKSYMSSLQEDTSSIKSMMTEMYHAFRAQSSLAPSSSVTLTFSITDTPTNVEGEIATHTATKEPPSHNEGETDANIQEKSKEPKQSIDTNIGRLKPEPIIDINIYPKTKPVVITVYKGTDGRNFDVHKPFLFGAFGIFELDNLRKIIPKKKNIVVKDLMNSLSRRYEGLRKIPRQLRIQSALPATEQAPS
uniref:Uncharacterized mitochondrial protein AtMg00810-like n=1 Tax=Tanacetum cinerariifolium TaxID=118510 RepID=A0A6L2K4V9_TANCI|nr:uncharacterized mitochondrial protein AtMg00810-like [Tanacetum cinerariifolium]